MGSAAVPVDLPHLWEQLGVRRIGPGMELDNQAPLAGSRVAICESIALGESIQIYGK
jgi:hypothetical protein